MKNISPTWSPISKKKLLTSVDDEAIFVDDKIGVEDELQIIELDEKLPSQVLEQSFEETPMMGPTLEIHVLEHYINTTFEHDPSTYELFSPPSTTKD